MNPRIRLLFELTFETSRLTFGLCHVDGADTAFAGEFRELVAAASAFRQLFAYWRDSIAFTKAVNGLSVAF